MDFWKINIADADPQPLTAETMLRGFEKLASMPRRICGLDHPHGPFHPDQIRRGGYGICWNCGRSVDFGDGLEP